MKQGKPTAAASVNYSAAMVQQLRAAEPLNLEKAKEIGAEIGRSYRSVIAKAKSLGLVYENKPAPAKRPKAMTKTELVNSIAIGLDGNPDDLQGLEKATATSLARLVDLVS